MKKIRQLYTFLLIAIFLSLNSVNTVFSAAPVLPMPAESAILIEQNTGKVLFALNEHKKIYPASTTKILTALVALEYLKPEDYVVVGDEIKNILWDSSQAFIKEGETVRVDNLLRGVMIPSGNEAACVVAREVARKVTGQENISYAQAEKLFCDLMTEKAKDLGALGSNFVNPHGYHNDNHYTTAYDMALVSREAMKNDLIKKIVAEIEFVGNGAGDNPDPSWATSEYKWTTHNELLLPNDYYYQHATGIKTGWHDQAGECVVASATKDGRDLIAAVFFSKDPGRWLNAIYLFNYGFDNYNTEIVQEEEQLIDTVGLSNPRLGEADTVQIYAKDTFSYFLSKDELATIQQDIKYKEEFIAPPAEGEADSSADSDKVKLITPLPAGSEVGTVTYTLNGEELFSGTLLTKEEILERNFNSDVDYYIMQFNATVFSLQAIPFWIIGIALLVLLIILVVSFRNKRRRSRNRLRRRY